MIKVYQVTHRCSESNSFSFEVGSFLLSEFNMKTNSLCILNFHLLSGYWSLQNKDVGARSNARYQRKIEELQAQCQKKTDECYQAWMSLTDLNKKLEDVRMELDNKCFQNHCLGMQNFFCIEFDSWSFILKFLHFSVVV